MTADDAVLMVHVGPGDLDDADLRALARARTVMGPAALLAAVRHLCPPVATLTATDDGTAPPPALAPAPVVVLSSAPPAVPR